MARPRSDGWEYQPRLRLRRRVTVCSALAVAMCMVSVSVSRSQGLTSSAVFGAVPFPEIDPMIEFGINVDRFTDSTKSTDFGRLRHYVLQRTYGLNVVHLSVARQFQHTAAVWRITGGLGYTGEEPTKYFQNRFLHHFFFLDSVPVDPTHLREGRAVASLTGEVNYWFDNLLFHSGWFRWNAPLFLGAGATGATLNHEAFVQVGLRPASLRAGSIDLPIPSFMYRASPWVHSSRLYPTGTIARSYHFSTMSWRIPLDRWWDSRGVLPEIEWGSTSTSGFYMATDSSGKAVPLPEKVCTIALHWAEGDFTAETYNDSCGNKDQGPTYGVRFFTRLRRPCDLLPYGARKRVAPCRGS